MALLYIGIVGLNSSGKTTLAQKLSKNLAISRVNGDEFRHFVRDRITYFSDADFSYPNPKSTALNPLVNQYRLELCRILLANGQSVINDGSGANREFRKPYVEQFKKDFPTVITVLIWANVPEEELLSRLEQRDESGAATRWKDMHFNIRKNHFEPPEANEADVVLEYNQHNYEDIKKQITELLA